MKNISLLLFFISGLLLAQPPQSNLEVSSKKKFEQAERVNNKNSQPIIDIYTSFIDFQDALILNCSDTILTLEDFEEGPSEVTVCGPIISDAGDGCFSAGELESGFNVQASNGTDVIYIPTGEIGNLDPLIGSEAFVEFTIINFSPNVYAVAMDLWENNVPETTVRIFGVGGVLMETLFLNTPTNTQTFFGVIADEPISSIEIEGVSNSGELFGNFFFGANCLPLSVNEFVLSQISLIPNPSSDFITINIPADIEIKSYNLYNLLGKIVLEYNNSNRINLSELSSGVYILNITTDKGSISKKIIRK